LFAYKKDALNQLVRKKHFNELDFLSYVGGILGLLAGFSALSFVELIYWFTIRVFIENVNNVDIKVYPFEDIPQNRRENSRIKEIFKNYFNESSIHGLKYIFSFSRLDRYDMLYQKMIPLR
jgi:hypothetical protein